MPLNLESIVKVFADDTSIFSLINSQKSFEDKLNRDLDRISARAYQWKMSFNPDLTKQATEVYFSRKSDPSDIPSILFNNIQVAFRDSQKHLGIILDKRLAFDKYSLFISECLECVNAPFCHVCSSKQDADSHLYIGEVGNYLISSVKTLKRFLVIDGVVSKYAAPVICTPYLDVPVRVDDEVSCVRKFALVSGICHSGSLHSGHYTAFARDDVCGGWLHLNDKAVTRTTLKALNGQGHIHSCKLWSHQILFIFVL